MPQKSLVAMIALADRESGLLGRFESALLADRAESPPTEIHRQDNMLSFYLGAEKIVVTEIDEPIPWNDLQGPCSTAWYWPEAARTLREHTAHLLVVAIPGGPDRKPGARRLMEVVAALVEASPASGIFWGGSGTVHAPGPFCETAEDTDDDRLPIEVWVGFGLVEESDGSHSIFTSGMEDFGLLELEIHRSRQNPQLLYQRLFDLVNYVLRSDSILHDGESIGISDEERIMIQAAKSLCDGTTDVLRLQM